MDDCCQDKDILAKYEEGMDSLMDYLEELMIETYGAFPRYDPFDEPPPRVLPPIEGETNGGASKAVRWDAIRSFRRIFHLLERAFNVWHQ